MYCSSTNDVATTVYAQLKQYVNNKWRAGRQCASKVSAGPSVANKTNKESTKTVLKLCQRSDDGAGSIIAPGCRRRLDRGVMRKRPKENRKKNTWIEREKEIRQRDEERKREMHSASRKENGNQNIREFEERECEKENERERRRDEMLAKRHLLDLQALRLVMGGSIIDARGLVLHRQFGRLASIIMRTYSLRRDLQQETFSSNTILYTYLRGKRVWEPPDSRWSSLPVEMIYVREVKNGLFNS
ncbi:hypothetical protein EVAR_51784_1 [Eumeta japonica]|uniref:Uncharacterized protein n=1 Tax=Eumeta variegata TaxID=151549 RepID=A0A4C1XFI0_EUMVA|nr:hypothetical protein EVAR_51784_1 [Eumeta japonica]